MIITTLIPIILLTGPLGDRLISDELGLSINLPPHSTVVQRPGDAGSHFMIRDGAATPTWSLKIDSPEIPGIDAKVCLQALLDSRNSTTPVDPATIALLETPQGRPMASVWTAETASNGQSVSLAWLVAPQSLNRCLVLSVVTTAPAEERGVFEQVFRSVRLTDRAADKVSLDDQFKAGQDILKSFTEKYLRGLVGTSMVLRVYDPTSDVPREIAYGTPRCHRATTLGHPIARQSSQCRGRRTRAARDKPSPIRRRSGRGRVPRPSAAMLGELGPPARSMGGLSHQKSRG